MANDNSHIKSRVPKQLEPYNKRPVALPGEVAMIIYLIEILKVGQVGEVMQVL